MDVLDARDLKPDPGVPAWQRRAQVVLARLPLVHSLFWIAFFLLIPPLLVGRGAVRADGGNSLDFVFKLDKSVEPTEGSPPDAAITNLFYWHNIVHDIFYLNGFDEPAGNFQENNLGLGGLGDVWGCRVTVGP